MTQLGFNTTRLVRDLCAVLDSLQIPFQTGVSEAVGLLRIDLALPDQQVCGALLLFSFGGPVAAICMYVSVSGNMHIISRLLCVKVP